MTTSLMEGEITIIDSPQMHTVELNAWHLEDTRETRWEMIATVINVGGIVNFLSHTAQA